MKGISHIPQGSHEIDQEVLEFSAGTIEHAMQSPERKRLAFFVRSDKEMDLFNQTIEELSCVHGLHSKQITFGSVLKNGFSIASGLSYRISQDELEKYGIFVLNTTSLPFIQDEILSMVPVIKDLESFARQHYPSETISFQQKYPNISFVGPSIYENYKEHQHKISQYSLQFITAYETLPRDIKQQVDVVLTTYMLRSSRERQYNSHFDKSLLIYGISPQLFRLLDKNDFDILMHSPNDHRERLSSIQGFCYDSFEDENISEDLTHSIGTTLSYEHIIDNFIKGQAAVSTILSEITNQ